MNNELVLAMAQAFAERLKREAGAQVEDQIQWGIGMPWAAKVEDEVTLTRPSSRNTVWRPGPGFC